MGDKINQPGNRRAGGDPIGEVIVVPCSARISQVIVVPVATASARSSSCRWRFHRRGHRRAGHLEQAGRRKRQGHRRAGDDGISQPIVVPVEISSARSSSCRASGEGGEKNEAMSSSCRWRGHRRPAHRRPSGDPIGEVIVVPVATASATSSSSSWWRSHQRGHRHAGGDPIGEVIVVPGIWRRRGEE